MASGALALIQGAWGWSGLIRQDYKDQVVMAAIGVGNPSTLATDICRNPTGKRNPFLILFYFSFERDRAWAREKGGGWGEMGGRERERERERERISSRLPAQQGAPCEAQSHDSGIMTRAEINSWILN